MDDGVPLRAMLAYLFGEVVKNFYLIHHPAQWIEYVTQSQRGDRSVDIDPARLPERAALETELAWERGSAGPERLNLWLAHCGATPFGAYQVIYFDRADLPGFVRHSGPNAF